MSGDLNGDNNITLADLVIMLSNIVNLSTLNEDYDLVADVNSDNNIDIFDLIHVIDSL